MNYADRLREDLRQGILAALSGSPGRRALREELSALLAANGLRPARAEVDEEIEWLERSGLVRAVPGDGTLLALLTERGADVAEGRAAVPGVRGL